MFSLLFRAILGCIFSTILLRATLSIFFVDVNVHHKISIQRELIHNFVMLLWLICNIIIWILMIPIFFSFLKRETPIRKASLLSVIGYIFSFFCILDCMTNEALIFASIFVPHMIRIIQLVAVTMRFCALVTQSVYQMVFLMELNAYRNKHSNTFLLRVYLSGNFNIIILIYMVVTAIYGFGDIFENWNTAISYIIYPLVLGLVELLYRSYAIWCYYLFHLRDRTVSLSSEHISESVMEQKSYERTYDCPAGFGSNLQFVSTEHFSAAK